MHDVVIVLAGLVAAAISLAATEAGRWTADKLARPEPITPTQLDPAGDVAERLERGEYTPDELREWAKKGVVRFRG